MGFCFFHYVVICDFDFTCILNGIQSCLGHVNWNKFLNSINMICFWVLPVLEQQKPVGWNRFRFDFDFKFYIIIILVWLIFLCKN